MTIEIKKRVLGISLAILLSGLIFVPGAKMVTNPQVLGDFDPPFLFPSVRTFAQVLYNVNLWGGQKQAMMDFMVAHYDNLLAADPYNDFKTLSPNTENYRYTSLTFGESYNYETDQIPWGSLQDLNTWVSNNWRNYAWSSNYANAAAAFEDCFLHVSQTTTFGFTMTESTLTIPAYDPAHPKLSRYPGPWDINYDWLMNPSSPVYRSFWQDYYMAYLAAQNAYGVMLDVQHIPDSLKFDKAREYASESVYYNDLKSLTIIARDSLHAADPAKRLGANDYDYFIAGTTPPKFFFEDELDFIWREGSIRFGKAADLVAQEVSAVNRVASAGTPIMMQQTANLCLASDAVCLARDRMAGLAEYFLAMNDNVYFYSNGGCSGASDFRTCGWFAAEGYDIGKPAGGYFLFASGQDPSHPSTTYKVFARRFTKGLVLLKPRPDWSATNYGDPSATILQLGGTFRPLNADGTLGAPVTSVTLRNWDGAILLENDTTPPSAVSNLTVQ